MKVNREQKIRLGRGKLAEAAAAAAAGNGAAMAAALLAHGKARQKWAKERPKK